MRESCFIRLGTVRPITSVAFHKILRIQEVYHQQNEEKYWEMFKVLTERQIKASSLLNKDGKDP